jgi:hypothetical protein
MPRNQVHAETVLVQRWRFLNVEPPQSRADDLCGVEARLRDMRRGIGQGRAADLLRWCAVAVEYAVQKLHVHGAV